MTHPMGNVSDTRLAYLPELAGMNLGSQAEGVARLILTEVTHGRG